jgi:hypothetical protein
MMLFADVCVCAKEAYLCFFIIELFIFTINCICLFILWFCCDYLYGASRHSFHWFSAVVSDHKPISVHMLHTEGGITSEW